MSTVSLTVKKWVPSGVRSFVKPVPRVVGRASAGFRPPPDFLVIGTKRGGTTSLWNWLLQHPSILPLVPAVQQLKSAHYFYWHYDRGLSWYRGFFPLTTTRRLAEWRFGARPVAGEASPYYLFDPRVPGRVAAALPDVKVIVLLRDPVERAYSHYRERVHEGVESLSFPEALAVEDERLSGELERMAGDPYYYSRPHDWFSYRSRGVYAPQLRAWQDSIPVEQILVIRSEDLYQQPQQTYQQVTRFIGVPDRALREVKRFNYHPSRGIAPEIRTELAEFYAPHNTELFDMLGRDFEWTQP